MCGSMADIQPAAAEIRRGKKKRKNQSKFCDGAEMAIFGDVLRPVFAASREQHI